jgi:hypothetical protein
MRDHQQVAQWGRGASAASGRPTQATRFPPQPSPTQRAYRVWAPADCAVRIVRREVAGDTAKTAQKPHKMTMP